MTESHEFVGSRGFRGDGEGNALSAASTVPVPCRGTFVVTSTVSQYFSL